MVFSVNPGSSRVIFVVPVPSLVPVAGAPSWHRTKGKKASARLRGFQVACEYLMLRLNSEPVVRDGV